MPLIRLLHNSGRLIFLAIWIGLLFLIATNIQAGWLYVVISFLALLALLSMLMPFFSLKIVSAHISLPELCERGAPQAAEVVLENRGRFARYMIRVEFPLDGAIGFEPPALLVVRLPGKSCVSYSARFIPRRRGVARLESIALSCGGVTGLFTSKRHIDISASTLVHPKVSESEGEALACASAESSRPVSKRLITEDPYHYSLREYAPGESLRRIHWKLTAKQNEPIIRIHECKTFGIADILVDNLRDHYPADGEELFEKLLEKAISLARHLLFTMGMSVTIAGTAAPELTLETNEVWENALRWFAVIDLEDADAATHAPAAGAGADFTFSPTSEAVH